MRKREAGGSHCILTWCFKGLQLARGGAACMGNKFNWNFKNKMQGEIMVFRVLKDSSFLDFHKCQQVKLKKVHQGILMKRGSVHVTFLYSHSVKGTCEHRMWEMARGIDI